MKTGIVHTITHIYKYHFEIFNLILYIHIWRRHGAACTQFGANMTELPVILDSLSISIVNTTSGYIGAENRRCRGHER